MSFKFPVTTKLLPEFKIEIGNTKTGQIGAVIYLRARSKRAVLNKFKAATGYDNYDLLTSLGRVHIYFNPKNVTLDHITRVEE